MKAIRTLPRMQRAAVVPFYFEDLPVGEVAESMGCAPLPPGCTCIGQIPAGELLDEGVFEDVP
jgi:hypothetical protein